MDQIRERVPNPSQQKVINELERNILLFASAGTGKTFSVAKRVSNIIRSGRARPEQILCLTFTIKAAQEMKDDILSYVGDDGKEVDTRTIHSFAFNVLKEESTRDPDYYCAPGVCDDEDSQEELKNCLLSFGVSDETPILHAKSALTVFSGALKHKRELLQFYSDDEARDFDRVWREIKQNEPKYCRKITTFYDPVRRMEVQDYTFNALMDRSAGQFMRSYSILCVPCLVSVSRKRFLSFPFVGVLCPGMEDCFPVPDRRTLYHPVSDFVIGAETRRIDGITPLLAYDTYIVQGRDLSAFAYAAPVSVGEDMPLPLKRLVYGPRCQCSVQDHRLRALRVRGPVFRLSPPLLFRSGLPAPSFRLAGLFAVRLPQLFSPFSFPCPDRFLRIRRSVFSVVLSRRIC